MAKGKRAIEESNGAEFQHEGISLTEEQWAILRGLVDDIDQSIARLEPETKKFKSEEKVVDSEDEDQDSPAAVKSEQQTSDETSQE
ncbi:hypothetical protein OGAPHI_007398 [Ogataea philodendri]|uniref:Uncharacterized protein n=1 Tax=Ogataea philodendri TaxID=1378263 RepID=A0A9P8NUN3_9ASCO|nr:uncharacterized protein OGAPHI_007398 [Ogataea philodendri]KAH3660193.1 hypothetical protein OGAPHI_007398 [Ogataea philodendri]